MNLLGTRDVDDAVVTHLDPANGAAFFDVDRTLIAGGAALRMAGPFRRKGLVTRRDQARAAIVQLGFVLRGADDTGIERFAAMARDLIAGWDREKVRAVIASELERVVHPTVYREALERIDQHHRQGQAVYAVSATMSDIVEPLAALLGLDGAIGSEMEVIDGRFTGEVTRHCHGQAKADRLREFASERGIALDRSSAYSDSISDRQFLAAVARPYAVNPDRELRKLAESQGWGILFFRTQVSAPWHTRRGVRGSLIVGALAAIAVGRRRRRRRQ